MNNSLIYLGVVVISVILLFFLVSYLIKKKSTPRIYKPKGPYLLSPGERKFFNTLEKTIDEDFYICPKVRIADIVEVDLDKNDRNFWIHLNRIAKKHVDFVVCDKETFKPQLIVELDGGSHKEKSQSLRDELVDKVFKDADIPILHIKPKNFYDYKTLREQIVSKLS